MLPAVSDRRDLDGEPASKRGVAGVRTHERYKKKKKASLTLPGRARTEITPWSIWSPGQCFTFSRCGWFVPSGEGSSSVFRGVTGFFFFFFKCRRSPPSSGNSYMCQDGRVDSQSNSWTLKTTQSQSESWWDRPTRRSRGKLIVSQRFPADLSTAKGARHWRSLRLSVKRNLTFRIRHRHPERWVSVCILLS